MKKLALCVFFALSALGFQATLNPEPSEARRGCCSHHGGVCGCSCCDGTALSDKCAPYYPSCSNPNATPQTPAKPRTRPTPRPTAKPKPQVKAKVKGNAFYCSVVGVHDGDTLTCLENRAVQHKIRLNGIDAPELKQAYGNDSKKFASDMVFSKQVRIIVTDIDRYGRLVGDVIIGDKRLNYESVRAGWAWHYGQYSKDPNFPVLERQARAAKKGLWADQKTPVAPWDFRKANKIAG